MNTVTHLIGKAWTTFFGWKVEGEIPEDTNIVFIAAPHTSNWDLPFMLGVAWTMGADLSWLGKHTVFEGAMGFNKWFFTALGGLPVDRRAPHGVVGKVVEMFGERRGLILAIPPEGTRSKVKYWKSGFYHIANGAQVPIGLGFLDFDRKAGGVLGYVMPTGDVRADMDKIRAFYRGVQGKLPHLQGEPRLREEDEVEQREPIAAE